MAQRGEKTRCGNLWTEARYHSFIKGLLRSGTMRWGPKQECLRNARIRRGFYLCAECLQEVPATLPPKEGNKKRIKNAVVDHIDPIIDPAVGFTTWDSVIENMFCEIENLQVLCHKCHTEKCNEEKLIAKSRKS